MKFLSNIKTKPRLIGSYLIVAVLIVVVAVISYLGISSINNQVTILYKSNIVPIQQLGVIDTNLMGLRGDLMKYILLPEQREAIKKTMETEKAAIQQNLSYYRSSSDLTKDEQAAVVAFETSINNYYSAIDDITKNIDDGKQDLAITSISDGGDAAVTRISASESITKLVALNDTYAKNAKSDAGTTYNNSLLGLIAGLVVCLVMAVGLGLIIANDITLPLAIASNAARKVSLGDLIRDMNVKQREIVVTRKDEIGDLGRNVISMIGYLQEIGLVTESISRNDLSVNVKLRSEKDELGHSLNTMLENLRQSIGEITDNANNLSAAAGMRPR